MKNKPLISVIIPLYNHEAFIEETIQSVLNQTFTDFELIVIDDGSKDNSVGLVSAIKDSRLTLLTQENAGAHNTLNRGIKLAQADYIAILNSDDIWHSQRLQKCMALLQSDSGLEAVFSYIECIDGQGDFIRYQEEDMDNYYRVEKPDNFYTLTINEKLLAGNFLYTTSNLICRKNVFKKLGGFNHLRFVHDYAFFLKLTRDYKVAIIKEYLLKYRFHDNNTISQNFAQSIFETGVVLADFLLHNKEVELDRQQQCALMEKFYRTINTYGSDRLLLTLLACGKNCDLKDLMESDESLAFRQTVTASIIENHEIMQKLSWQKEQTDMWWEKAQHYKAELAWQKEQTNMWRGAHQKLEMYCKFKWVGLLMKKLYKRIMSLFGQSTEQK